MTTRVFFLLGAVLLLVLAFNDMFFLGLPLVHAENLVRISGILLCGIAAYQTSPVFHTLLAATSAILLITFTAVSCTVS